jgi:hypothetical protein
MQVEECAGASQISIGLLLSSASLLQALVPEHLMLAQVPENLMLAQVPEHLMLAQGLGWNFHPLLAVQLSSC